MLKPLLTAHWNYLALLNFVVDPAALAPHVPIGTELDSCAGETCVSVVGLLVYHTMVTGLPVPRHRNFEEVSVRFYVRKKSADTWRRGTVSLRRLVPRCALPVTARLFEGEPYQALPMRSEVADAEGTVAVKYEWRRGARWEGLTMTAHGSPQAPVGGTHEEFLIGRDWAFTARANTTSEYRVEHPRWKIWPAESFEFAANLETLSGEEFVPPLSARPRSAFIADGSFVSVYTRSD